VEVDIKQSLAGKTKLISEERIQLPHLTLLSAGILFEFRCSVYRDKADKRRRRSITLTLPVGGSESTKSSNLTCYFSGTGLIGLAGYVYLDGSPTPFSPAAVSSPTKPKQENYPERFLDLKLKVSPHGSSLNFPMARRRSPP
jgi:hypothetical protein